MAVPASNLRLPLIRDIHKYEAVKFGSFTLKSGLVSPVYVDIRICVSHPTFLQAIAEAMEQSIKSANVSFEHLCGVPYTALPIATCISTKTHQPMLMRRKEAKAYGTKQIVEGKHQKGDKVLIIEDIITSGSSILETVAVLEDVGLHVTDAVVFIDREQGGAKYLEERGIRLHSVLKLSEIIDQFESQNLIGTDVAAQTREFLATVRSGPIPRAIRSIPRLSFQERARLVNHPVAKKLLHIIYCKKTNLCVAVDVTTSNELLTLIKEIGPYVCAVKTHVDALLDFEYGKIIPELKQLAETHDFLLFEDRKFADIGKTVQLQYSQGLYKISEWAHLVTVHGIAGEGVIKGLESVANKNNACVLVAEMSSAGALTNDAYKGSIASLTASNSDFVIGVVSQSRVVPSSDCIQFTPGVHFDSTEDGLGQKYVSPEVAIGERGADIIIVGRGIIQATNPAERAKLYSERSWKAYEKSLQK